MAQKDYLWLNIRELPYFRGFLRAVESRFYQDYTLPSPTLDLGCGDGQFASVTFERKLEVGVDPWADPLQSAKKSAAYDLVSQSSGANMPFPDEYFSSALSNSVLEHIPDLDPVIREVARVLQPGGVFLFCVPNQNFLSNLSIAHFFNKLRLFPVAKSYQRFFNRISRHHHCDSPQIWKERLEKSGFVIDKWWHYFSPQALGVLEWGHYFGLPSYLVHKLTGRWILSATPWNLALTRKIVQPFYDEPTNQPQGSYTFYVTHKVG